MKLRHLSKYLLASAAVLALTAATANAQLVLNHTSLTISNVVGPASGTVLNNGTPDTTVQFFTPTSGPVFLADFVPTNVSTNFILDTTYKVDQINLNAIPGSISGVTTSFDFTMTFDFGPLGGADLVQLFHFTITPSDPLFYSITPTTASGVFTIGTTQYTYAFVVDGIGGGVSTDPTASDPTSNINLKVGLVPVPEPSTYGMFAAMGLTGFAAYRRFRGSKKAA